MSVSLDCNDGQHRACSESGGCCCECHDLEHNGFDHCPGCQAAYQAAREVSASFDAALADWSAFVWPTPAPGARRTRARHAAQPRGASRLMSDPTWRLNLAAGGGVVLGMLIMLAAAAAARALGVIA